MAEIITTIIDIFKKADFSILFKNTMQFFPFILLLTKLNAFKPLYLIYSNI